ncbi:MAG: hypothetical protein GY699_03745 [Desulfobacteraceae bacterium]|nr:hypothetical protein [Desulfobacteraceae bacterium]
MEPDVLETDRYIRCHNIVVYSGTGIVLFNLLCSLKYFLLEKHLYRSQLLKYSYLATLIMQVVAIFVFTDIVLQNWGGVNTTISTFSMRYQAIAALLGVELLVLRSFFATFKNKV